jgi:hypothetical protein
MKKRILALAVSLLALSIVGAEPDEARIKKGLVGTWENISIKPPAQFKDVTQTFPHGESR